jgi:hypothetical protein
VTAAGIAWRPGRRARSGLSSRFATALASLSVALLFTISALTLNLWGFNYETAGGIILEKIHPATWLAFAALACLLVASPARLAFLNSLVSRNPGIVVYLAAFAVLFQHIVLVQRMPFTPIIDTFLSPAALFVCLTQLAPRTRSRLAFLLHFAMLLNAVLGIYEFASGWRLTPFSAAVGGIQFETDWRSSALLGHPLTNAMTTGVYVLALLQGAGRDLPALLRPAAMVVQLIAMVAFGGRASLVILLALSALVGARGFFRVALGARINVAQTAMVLAAIPLAAIVLDQAIASGFFDRLIERFTDDRGSAKARLVLAQLINQFSWSELLIGPDPDKVASLMTLEGVEFGIESFWIGFMLSYGLIASLLFFIGLGFFCRELLRQTRSGGFLALVYFFAVATTSVSISAKSLTLAQLTAILLVCLPRLPEPGAPKRAVHA